MRFSIIIPVYNVEKYIDKCMYTVMHQSFDDYEVIVVDDESPDHSMDIVQKYVDAFPGRIHVIHQKNTRQGGARNRGVQAAKGEYILFVDSDDYVHTDMLKVVDAHLRETPSDILVFQHAPVTPDGAMIPSEVYGSLPSGTYCPAQTSEVVLIPTGPVNKAFRRTFYTGTNVRFPEKVLYEDGVMRLIYALASSITVCSDVLYYYVQSPNSSIRREISDKMLDILTVTDMIVLGFQENNIYKTFAQPLDCALIYGVMYILDLINSVQPNHPIQKQMVAYLGEHFPDYRENPWVDPALRKSLDCLLTYNFTKYHYRFLVFNRFKEKLMQISLLKRINNWRKRNNHSGKR